MKKLLKEPLLHFLLIGALVFAIDAARRQRGQNSSSQGADVIAVNAAVIDRLRAGYERQFGQAPDDEALRGLVNAHIREEVLYREALALGLEQNDSIVRRRLAQKMEFLTDDLTVALDAPESVLRAYYQTNAARYSQPPRLTFRHVYLGQERHGPKTDSLARSALSALKAGANDDSLGDPFLHGFAFQESDPQELAALFGTDFVDAILKSTTGQWFGPVPSSYGLHLVHVSHRTETQPLPWERARGLVLKDFNDERRRLANQQIFERLRQRYRITVDESALRPTSETEAETAQASL